MLTEHLQYPAVSLVDDIINAVNEIMYNCTAAMEKYLFEKHVINGVDYTEEIRIGIAKLETLLENSVDKNFDKLELYVLRNVLRIPQELLDANVFRLKYQRNLIIASDAQQQDSVKELESKVRQIESAFTLHSQLSRRIKDTKKLTIKVRKFKELITSLLACQNSETKEIFRSLKPLDDSLKLITSQLRQLYLESEEYGSMEQVNDINKDSQANKNLSKSRSVYIETKANLILKKLQADLPQKGDEDTKTLMTSTLTSVDDIQSPQLSVLEENT